jgi:hypothetical protein
MAEIVSSNVLVSTPRALLQAVVYKVVHPTDVTTGAGGSIVKGPSFETIGAPPEQSVCRTAMKDCWRPDSRQRGLPLQISTSYRKYQVYPQLQTDSLRQSICSFVVEQLAVLAYNKVVSRFRPCVTPSIVHWAFNEKDAGLADSAGQLEYLPWNHSPGYWKDQFRQVWFTYGC